MKRLGCILIAVGFLLYAGLFVVLLKGAQTPPPLFGPPRLASLTAAPVIDMQGTLIAFPIRASYQVVEHKPDGTVDARQLGSIEVDLLKTNGTVVVDGLAVDDREAVDHLIEILAREWRKTHPDPLPVRRRSLRSK